MAEHVIRLPDVGEGIAEAELVEWHVKVGDLVRADTTLAAVMTDKATVEIPSPVDGEIAWLGAEIGDKVAVGSDLVRLKIPGERDAASAAQPQPRPAAAEAAKPAPVATPRAADSEDRGTTPAVSATPTPRPATARRAAAGSARNGARRGGQAARVAGGAPARARGGHRPAPGARARVRPAASRTTTSTHSPIAVPGVMRIARTSAEERSRRRQGDRAAAQDRRADGGGARTHPAYHLCRRGRCHGAGRVAGDAEPAKRARSSRGSRCCRS